METGYVRVEGPMEAVKAFRNLVREKGFSPWDIRGEFAGLRGKFHFKATQAEAVNITYGVDTRLYITFAR
jgi:hypothetical protein